MVCRGVGFIRQRAPHSTRRERRQARVWKALFRLLRMHWKHEPTPPRPRARARPRGQTHPIEPKDENEDEDEPWFMESLLSLLRMHWGPEPADRAVASWTAPVLWRFGNG